MTIFPFVLEIKKLLGNLDTFLGKAIAHAEAKKYDPNTLLQFRLAPDMLPLVFQIQSTCDSAKYAAARTSGKTPPSHADTETTIDETRKRIATVVAYLDEFKASDFEHVTTHKISLPRWEGKAMNGLDYFIEHAQPNFMFHLSMSYAILRHNGIEVGKRDYLGTMSMK